MLKTWYISLKTISITESFNFTTEQHLGFEIPLFYWHFVDVIWIFLYIILYIWI